MKKILLVLCGLFLLVSPTLAQRRYDDRFERSQNKQEWGDSYRDQYQKQQQRQEETERRLQEQERELNRLKRQQEELRNQTEFNRIYK